MTELAARIGRGGVAPGASSACPSSTAVLDAAQQSRLTRTPGELLQLRGGGGIGRKNGRVLQAAEFVEGGERQDQLDRQVSVVHREFELDIFVETGAGDADEFLH